MPQAWVVGRQHLEKSGKEEDTLEQQPHQGSFWGDGSTDSSPTHKQRNLKSSLKVQIENVDSFPINPYLVKLPYDLYYQ